MPLLLRDVQSGPGPAGIETGTGTKFFFSPGPKMTGPAHVYFCLIEYVASVFSTDVCCDTSLPMKLPRQKILFVISYRFGSSERSMIFSKSNQFEIEHK